MNDRDRYIGCLLGLAVGDAYGAPFEGTWNGSFEPPDRFEKGGFHDSNPGEWTDDTSLALCLADSLLSKKALDLNDVAERFLRWHREGYKSSREVAFGIGGTCRKAIESFEETGKAESGPDEYNSAGNGSIMRLAPVPMVYAHDPLLSAEMSEKSSRVTHQAQQALDCCRILGYTLASLLGGSSKAQVLNSLQRAFEREVHNEVIPIINGSYKTTSSETISTTAYVVQTLEAAFWAFWNSSGFFEGLKKLVALGGDTDTTGAVYGQIAGAFYGRDGIPEQLVDELNDTESIQGKAVSLLQLSNEFANGK
ncbi:MAG: ADP-ribosylglycohydrolase family protein [Planctomycetota bacterium]|nr:ADP-ribosylglycohydrolase family protein [Planctomycetota bacterium]